MADDRDPTEEIQEEMDAHTIALRVVAGLLIAGAMHLLGAILVPFFLAMVLAIALSPLMTRLERVGLPRLVTSLLGTLFVATVLAVTVGLIAQQVGSILENSDRYLDGLSRHMANLSRSAGGDRMMESLGVISAQTDGDPAGSPVVRGGAEAGPEVAVDSAAFWRELLQRHARALGRWVLTGLGGLLGFIGATILFLAFLFYMLLTRADWVDRLRQATAALGLRPRSRELGHVREGIATYIKYLFLVSICYVVVTTVVLWLLGVPQPLLWGVLTGLLEMIPYFGPLIAGALPTAVALGTGQGWWQPVAVAGFFMALQTFEGYVIAPLLYGKAVEIDPVTVLLGVLFFGWLWGPLGLALAMPMLIFLRGLLAITPDTPALDALVDADAVRS